MKTKALLATLCIAVPAACPLLAESGASAMPIGNVQGSAEREIARRQQALEEGRGQLNKAEKAIDEKDYETAISILIALLRDVSESKYSHAIREDAKDDICSAYVKLAEQRILEGRYKDAENLCNEALKYEPEYRPAIKLMARLEDPEYFNKTITPGHVAHIEEVKKLLVEADGFYQSGRYDLAFKRYELVLGIDPYNIAARKGEEKIELAKSNYGMSAYNETRARAMWQIDNAWQNPVRKYGQDRTSVIVQDQLVKGTAAIEAKLNKIIIPKIDFRETSIREAIDFLKDKSRQLDPEKVGVNIVLKLDNASAPPAAGGAAPADTGIPGLATTPAAPVGGPSNPSETRITLSLSNIPLVEALRYITDLANLKVKVDPYAVSIVPVWVNTDVMITKQYKVPPGFIQNVPAGGGGAEAAGGFGKAGGAEGANTGKELVGNNNARQYLEDKGIQFPAGATAQYLAGSGKLIVHNTQSNIDLIDALVDAISTDVPKQVEIEAKFVEIQQNNLKELSFDWLLGQFNIPGSQRVFGGGGTQGTAPALNSADFPFVPPGGSPVGTNPLTGGLRGGNQAISQNAIDALLAGAVAGSSTLSPAAFALAGVFTDPQFQVVIHALNQKKGIDLLSAPRVTTKAGQRAVIEIIREFRYPTEFDPPQIPQNFGGGSTSSGLGGSSTAVFPVTPTTPTAFETRNTGVTLEVEPQVSSDGATIDLNLVPQVVEFEGFINYGSPIKTVNPAALASTSTISGVLGSLVSATVPTGKSDSVVLTDNVINQPIFSTRKVTTSVSIWDGQTVVLGGLMREDVQKVEDKVPLLGDIPLVGRLFRSQVDQHLKRNLIIFVTARLMNPAGEPLREDAENEEDVQPLPLPEGLPPAQQPEAPLFSK